MKTQPKVDASYIETFSFDGNNGSGEYLDMGQNMTNTYLNNDGEESIGRPIGPTSDSDQPLASILSKPSSITGAPKKPTTYMGYNPRPLPADSKPTETQKTSPFALFKSGGLVPIPTPLGAVVLIGALGLGIWGISKLLK